jgi:hypothetical protein
MSGYDFIVDTDKLNEFIASLDAYYQTLQEDISELRGFFGVGDVDAKWSGQAYNDLKSKYDTSATSYDAVLSYISAYKNLVSKVESSATTLCSNIVAACDM